YGQVAQEVTAPCGSKLPNRWGQFDVVGNVWEATGNRLAGISYVKDRHLPALTLCGGGYDSGPIDCRINYRTEDRGDLVPKTGFRVACVGADPSPGPVVGPEDARATLEFLSRAASDDVALLRIRADLNARFANWQAAAADYSRLVQQLTDPDLFA